MSLRLKQGLLTIIGIISLFFIVAHGYGATIEYIYDANGNLIEKRITQNTDTTAPTTIAIPPGGTYWPSVQVALQCHDGDGSGCDKTYYTIDGSIPTTSSPIYSSPITISSTTTLRFFSKDKAGNSEQPNTQTYTISPSGPDTIPPTTTPSPAEGFYTSAQSVALNCTDSGGSGCDKIYYTIGGATPTTSSTVYSSPIYLTETSTVRFFAKDHAGNSEPVNTAVFIIDRTLCSDSLVKLASTGQGYPTIQAAYEAVTVSGDVIKCREGETFVENLSIHKNISVSLEGGWGCGFTRGDGIKTTIQGSLTTTPGGGTLTVKNIILAQGPVTPPTSPDTTPPTTTPYPPEGIYNSTLSVLLVCTDTGGSGCSDIHYTTDGSNPSLSSAVYSTPINIPVNTTLKFFARDAAGNQEQPFRTQLYTIDPSIPMTTTSQAAGSYYEPQTVTLNCSDASGMGCDKIYYTTDGTMPTTSSAVYSGAFNILETTTLRFFGKDFAGNLEPVRTVTYNIDASLCPNPLVRIGTAPPYRGYDTLQSAYNAAGNGETIQCRNWAFTENLNINQNKPVTLEGGWNCQYTSNAGSKTTLKGSLITQPGGGTLTLENFIIGASLFPTDHTPPTSTATPAGGMYDTSLLVFLSCEDGSGSGCDKIYYTTDGSTPITTSLVYTGPIEISVTTTLRFFSKDRAGNREPEKSQVYTLGVDTTSSVSSASLPEGTYDSAQSVALSCDDPGGWGCDKIYYTTDGSTPTTSSAVYSGPIIISSTTTIKFFATDLAGNSEQVKTQTYTITGSPTGCPAAPASYPTDHWDRVWCDSSFTNKLADGPGETNIPFDTDWGTGVVAGIASDNIGFRSGRTINFPSSGEYQFTVGSDDGVRVWIDNTLVLDKFIDRGYTADTFTRNLTAGDHQVRLDYYDKILNARVSFSYTFVSPSCGDGTCNGGETCSTCPQDCGACPSGNPIAHWAFDEGSGTIVQDSSGNGNNGTLLNGPVWTTGQSGGALIFDGVDDWMSVPSINGLATGNTPHTIAAWVKVISLPPYRAWILLLGNEGTGSHVWLIDYIGLTALGVWNGAYLSPGLAVGEWRHLAVTFDGTTLTGYLDGALVDQRAASFDLQGIPLTVGKQHASESYFNGVIDDLRIYNRALTQPEVQALVSGTPYCGDGTCNGGETCSTCPQDCGTCPDTTPPTTTATPPEGAFSSAVSVALNCGDSGGSGCDKIYYTTDGLIPTTASPVYSNAINISVTTTLKFFAKDLAGNSEQVKTQTYTITGSPAVCPAAPASYPTDHWDRVWCDISFSNKLADGPGETNVQFDTDWGNGLVAGIASDNIGFRSGRTVNFPSSGEYQFTVGSDDGVRVWIDNVLVLDKFLDRAYTTDTFTRTLTAGDHQVRLDYYEAGYAARVSFSYTLGSCSPPSAPGLGTPANGATNVPIPTQFLIYLGPGGDTYHIAIATDSEFTNVVVYQELTWPYYVYGLSSGTTYYYRINESNSCGTSPWSSTWSFTTVTNNDLVGLWALDDGAGTVAADSSGTGNNATVNGGAAWTIGKVGGALSLDGVDDWMSVPSITGLATGNTPHTIAAWVKVISLPPYRAWILLLGNEGTGSHHWLIDYIGLTALGVWSGGQVSPGLTVGQWKHLAVTFDGTTLSGYVDGALVDQRAATFNLTGTPLTVGQQHISESYFNGVIDDLRIYNRALTQPEVQALVQGGQ